jgi:hypothetical protein
VELAIANFSHDHDKIKAARHKESRALAEWRKADEAVGGTVNPMS